MCKDLVAQCKYSCPMYIKVQIIKKTSTKVGESERGLLAFRLKSC